MTFEQAVDYIESIPKFTKKTSLENTKYLLNSLKISESQFQIFHIAGTNGKGSVCTFLSYIFQETGEKAGLFTSPHLVDIRERIRINGELVDKNLFTEAFQTIYDRSRQIEREGYSHPAYFEFLFAMAMYIFSKEKVRIVILETGLGGRLDATNAVEKKEMSIITSIDMDHTEILGDTIEQIAFEKAGIIKENIAVVYIGEPREAAKVIEKTAKEKQAPFYGIFKKNYKILKITNKSIDFCVLSGYYEKRNFSLPFPALYQAMNGLLAIKAIEVFDKERKISAVTIQKAFDKTKWQGRMEQILPNVYLDGAHNEAGIRALIETVKQIDSIAEKKKYLLFSAVKEKEYEKMAKLLCEGMELEEIILTEISGRRKVSADILKTEFMKNTKADIEIYRDVETAFLQGLEKIGDDGVLFCVGSLYLIGDIEALIKEKQIGDKV